jgi:hypothetical protein
MFFMAQRNFPHPERERSEQSKDAPLLIRALRRFWSGGKSGRERRKASQSMNGTSTGREITARHAWRIRRTVGRHFSLAAALVALAVLPGCDLLILLNGAPRNDITPVKPEAWIASASGRATIVYGLADDAKWPYPELEIDLDRYSIERGETIEADCERYDHTEASVPAGSAELHYFIFDAPAGDYVFSRQNGAALMSEADITAFSAPAGSVVYVGEFINRGKLEYTGTRPIIQFQRDLDAAKRALARHKDLAERLTLASAVVLDRVAAPQAMCVP